MRKDGAGQSRTYVLSTGRRDSDAVARSLRGIRGVVDAEPNRYVNTMNTGARSLPSTAVRSFPAAHTSGSARTGGTPSTSPSEAVPANDTLSTSAQAFLNSGGVNAIGAFSLLQGRYGQQPEPARPSRTCRSATSPTSRWPTTATRTCGPTARPPS
ncbi:hypothetical protein E4K10_40310 [Streptomyces sp. T1317-0309]|nr:hypothetical protein E4K10_40310 [Streptomyces sp. T1317-0309]